MLKSLKNKFWKFFLEFLSNWYPEFTLNILLQNTIIFLWTMVSTTEILSFSVWIFHEAHTSMMFLGLNMSMKYENCEIIKWYASSNSILSIPLYSESYLCLPFLNVSCLWFWAGFQCDFWRRMEPKLVTCWYMKKKQYLV